MEIFFGTACLLFTTASVAVITLVIYIALTTTALQIFFATAARYKDRQSHATFMLSVAYALLGGITASLILTTIDWTNSSKACLACIGIVYINGLALTHSLYGGECPVAVVIEVRMILSTILSLGFLQFLLA